MKQLPSIAIACLIAICTSSCAGATPNAPKSIAGEATSVPAATLAPAPTSPNAPAQPAPIQLETCYIGNAIAKCGAYRVFENRKTMQGRQIDLKIVVLPATEDRVEPDPLFYFAGGPGGAATHEAPLFKREFSELNKTRDIVLIDQRGTGGSNLLICSPPDKPFEVSDAAALSAYAESCLKKIDADARWYTTRAYVDDVNEVRQALGYDKINISGGSYGGTVVQVYLQQYPETVRAALINNSTLLDYPIFENIAGSSQRALDLIFARCAKDEKCHAAFPDPKADLDAAFAQLHAQPMPTSVTDAQNGQAITVTPALLAGVIHQMLLSADQAARLPRLIHRLTTEKDWDAVGRIHANQILPQQRAAAGLVMYAVIRCAEPWAASRLDVVAEDSENSYAGDVQLANAQSFAHTCNVVPKPEPEALYGQAQKTDVPVLVLNAEEDPQNPPENVAKTAEIYPNSKVVFEPYRGHITVNWACLSKVYTEFINLGNVKDLQAECLSKVRPYAFDVQP